MYINNEAKILFSVLIADLDAKSDFAKHLTVIVINEIVEQSNDTTDFETISYT